MGGGGGVVDEKGEGRGGGASGFMVGIGECARENHVADYSYYQSGGCSGEGGKGRGRKTRRVRV